MTHEDQAKVHGDLTKQVPAPRTKRWWRPWETAAEKALSAQLTAERSQRQTETHERDQLRQQLAESVQLSQDWYQYAQEQQQYAKELQQRLEDALSGTDLAQARQAYLVAQGVGTHMLAAIYVVSEHARRCSEGAGLTWPPPLGGVARVWKEVEEILLGRKRVRRAENRRGGAGGGESGGSTLPRPKRSRPKGDTTAS